MRSMESHPLLKIQNFLNDLPNTTTPLGGFVKPCLDKSEPGVTRGTYTILVHVLADHFTSYKIDPWNDQSVSTELQNLKR